MQPAGDKITGKHRAKISALQTPSPETVDYAKTRAEGDAQLQSAESGLWLERWLKP